MGTMWRRCFEGKDDGPVAPVPCIARQTLERRMTRKIRIRISSALCAAHLAPSSQHTQDLLQRTQQSIGKSEIATICSNNKGGER